MDKNSVLLKVIGAILILGSVAFFLLGAFKFNGFRGESLLDFTFSSLIGIVGTIIIYSSYYPGGDDDSSYKDSGSITITFILIIIGGIILICNSGDLGVNLNFVMKLVGAIMVLLGVNGLINK